MVSALRRVTSGPSEGMSTRFWGHSRLGGGRYAAYRVGVRLFVDSEREERTRAVPRARSGVSNCALGAQCPAVTSAGIPKRLA